MLTDLAKLNITSDWYQLSSDRLAWGQLIYPLFNDDDDDFWP